jgi:hypothetical protein
MGQEEEKVGIALMYANAVHIAYSIYDFSMFLGLQGHAPGITSRKVQWSHLLV